MTTINNLRELAEEVCYAVYDDDTDEQLKKRIAKALFKATSSGICFGLTEEGSGVEMAGYCEGLDYWDFDNHCLQFPFEMEEFWKAATMADKDGVNAWNETHGCDECASAGWGNPETGYTMINPECPSCNGDGIII